MMLQPLKGEVGYKLAASKWSKTPTQAPLASNYQIDLMVLSKVDRFFHPSWLRMLLHVDLHRSYAPIYLFHHLMSKTPCPRFQ